MQTSGRLQKTSENLYVRNRRQLAGVVLGGKGQRDPGLILLVDHVKRFYANILESP